MDASSSFETCFEASASFSCVCFVSSSASLTQTICSISTSFPGAAASLSPRARYRVPGCALLRRPKTATRYSRSFRSRSLRLSARPWSSAGHACGIPSARTGALSHSFHTHCGSKSFSSLESFSPASAKGRVASNVSQ